MTTTDVVIIGAGAAGLTAAYDLVNSGLDAIVLEASGRPLGRLRKDDTFASFPLDVGGEWIHTDPSILRTIVGSNDVDIPTVRYNPTYHYWDDNEWARENWSGTDYKFIGYTWFDFFNDFFLMQILSDNVVFNCPVDSIAWGGVPAVEVSCGNRTWSANHVIITTPIKTLQDGDIEFLPALPQTHTSAMAEMTMLAGIKVFFKFTNKFYNFQAFSLDNDSIAGNERFFYDATFGQGNTDDVILGFFAIGPAAEPYADQTDASITSSLIAELDAIFNNQASKNLESSLVQNWSNEPYIRGAYITIVGDRVEPIKTLRRPVNNTLFFAGEAIPTSDYEWGFAHGAALSGRRTAQLILSSDSSIGGITIGTVIAAIATLLHC